MSVSVFSLFPSSSGQVRCLAQELNQLIASLPFQDPEGLTELFKVMDGLMMFREPAFLQAGLWTAVGAIALFHSSESAQMTAWSKLNYLLSFQRPKGAYHLLTPTHPHAPHSLSPLLLSC